MASSSSSSGMNRVFSLLTFNSDLTGRCLEDVVTEEVDGSVLAFLAFGSSLTETASSSLNSITSGSNFLLALTGDEDTFFGLELIDVAVLALGFLEKKSLMSTITVCCVCF
ncbi:hypothetical protein WICPIJ_006721 [Wickerhamomyces pijperi]|uniref:Uncharacterized protein n=1 Tax=Wickerhamomyces pijperi TaxID=599730 RepID=A0A9P8TKL9_WICPI|nr:hypothetical protein WICPIJ_006721 [Wickerhamomyces pijperi]